jgi:type II secretory pathway pseudopilin PulG
VDTMTAVYAAQSMQGPAALIAFRLHAIERKEQSLCLEQTRQEKQHGQDHKTKKQRGERQQQVLSRKQQQQQQQQQQAFQEQQLQVFQQQQQQAFQQQQLYMQACFPMPWLPQPITVPLPVPEHDTAPAPYGRAVSTLRHMYDEEIKGYFESLGFCVNARPGAAQVAAVFQELCKLRSLGTLPKKAKWFEFSTTRFDDAHETPFKNFIRKLYSCSSA